LAADFGVALFPGYEDMLRSEDVDAVLLATIHKLHAGQTIAAARHGKHVLVEKPMMTNVADCDAMIAACREAGVTLSVIHTLRYRGVFARARNLIQAGRIGEVRMVQMNTLWPLRDPGKPWLLDFDNGGDILDRCSHSFDMLRFLIDDEPVRLFGTVNAHSAPNWQARNAMAQVHFSRGASAQVWMSHELPEPGFPRMMDFVRVWGEKGMLEAEHFGKLRLATGGEWRDVWEMPGIDFLNKPFEPKRLEAFFVQTQDFVDCLRHGRPPAVSGGDGRAAIEMIEATHLSNRTGAAVELPLPRAAGGHHFDGATVERTRIRG
jgi:predicted dehydrogenase